MLVKDRMTPNPVSISPDTTFPEAYQVIRDKGIRHVPVVDKNKKIVGVTTKTDLLHVSPSVTTSLSVFEANYLLQSVFLSPEPFFP